VNAPPPPSKPAQVPVGPLVASIGAVLLVVSLFLDWYDQITGFTVFEVLDLVLVALALLTIASLLSGLGVLRPVLSPETTLGVAVLALVIVASQIVNHPPAAAGAGGPSTDTGIWLALAASVLMVAGAVLNYARISVAVDPRDR
jgi:hypothetical protein